jgi:hypothetical protein
MKSKLFILALIILSLSLIACEVRLEEKNIYELNNNIQDNVELIEPEKHDHDDDHEHEHSVEIEGREMRMLTIQEIADLWEINSEDLLYAIITEFDLKKEYTQDTLLDVIRLEHKFSPGLIKDLAEDLKART